MIRDQNQVRMPALASVISAMMVWAADADGPTGDGLTDGRTDDDRNSKIRPWILKRGLGLRSHRGEASCVRHQEINTFDF